MKAVNLILLKPDMVERHDHTGLEEIEAPDIELLQKVIALAKQYPGSTTPELLGRIYATPAGSQLMQLANREQITPTEGVEAEYSDLINHFLSRQDKKRNLESIMQEARDRLNARKNPASEASGPHNSSDISK